MGSSGLGKAATLDELLSTCIEMFGMNSLLCYLVIPPHSVQIPVACAVAVRLTSLVSKALLD